jgi:hypothetical protein
VNASTATGGGVYTLGKTSPGTLLHAYPTPIGLVFTGDGDGFVTDNAQGVLYRFVGADSSMVWANTFHDGDDDPAGMVVAPPGFDGPNVAGGDLLVADHGNGGPDEIWAVSPDSANGERLLVPDPGTADWYDLATDGATVWAADALDPDALWIVHPDGTTSLLGLSQNIPTKRALAYDAGQDVLYALRTTNPRGLYRIDPDDGLVTLVADGFADLAYGNLEIDPVARKLWVSDPVQSRIYEICLPPAGPVAAAEGAPAIPALSLSLLPNPFVRGTRIALDLPRASQVRIDVVDSSGRRVRSLDGGRRPAGRVDLEWDARDGRGRRVAAGVYFVRLEADGRVRSAKAVVLR